ncbi:MAG: radical SAM protein, partial [Flavobacteriales bacterium]|nr:radical SAM protein [Flavobacteriales bacterium]
GQLHRLLEAANNYLQIDSKAEISIEANPDDMSEEKLLEWQTLGISRLSVGLQSFQNKRLTWMNRAHNAEEALACVKRAQDIGFDNISIDLIYGLPTSSLEEWKEELAIAKSMNVQHFSAYILTVEERTALH